MLFNARTLTGIAVAGCMLALLSSCTTGSGVEDPSASGNVSDLALEDFSGRAAIMASWELVCPPVSLDPVVD